MWRQRREGGRATSSDSVNLSNVGSSFTWKIQEGLCVHQLLALKVKKIHCVFLIRIIWGIFELIPSPARGYKQRQPPPPHTYPPTTPPQLSVCSSILYYSCKAQSNYSLCFTGRNQHSSVEPQRLLIQYIHKSVLRREVERELTRPSKMQVLGSGKYENRQENTERHSIPYHN